MAASLPSPCHAVESPANEGFEDWAADFAPKAFEFGGLLKVLGTAYRVPEVWLGEESWEASGLLSLRLRLEGSPLERLDYEVHLRAQADVWSDPVLASLTGLTVSETTLFRGLGSSTTWDESESHRLWWEVDYANVRLGFGNTDVVIGRQAVTFGRSFLWNPIDWLSTFTPTEIDREFKGGVDVARVTFGLGRFSGAEILYAYGEDGERDASALMGRTFWNVAGWDVELLGGSVWIDDRYGLAFSGDVGGAGLRGELSWQEPRVAGEPDFLRATLGVDYRWRSSLQWILELHYNGFGTSDTAEYAELFRHPRFATGQVSNIGRRYLGSVVSYELTPLLEGSVAVLGNLDDESGLLNPGITLSLSDESELTAGAILPWGASAAGDELRSEYGSYPETAWLQLRLTF